MHSYEVTMFVITAIIVVKKCLMEYCGRNAHKYTIYFPEIPNADTKKEREREGEGVLVKCC